MHPEDILSNALIAMVLMIVPVGFLVHNILFGL